MSDLFLHNLEKIFIFIRYDLKKIENKHIILCVINVINNFECNNNEHEKAYDVIDILHAVPNVIIINERKSKRLFYKTYIKKFSRKWKEHFFDKMKVLFK